MLFLCPVFGRFLKDSVVKAFCTLLVRVALEVLSFRVKVRQQFVSLEPSVFV